MMVLIGVSFFFSSRRRHTRLQGDWSSDVCSSDLRRRPRSRLLDGGGSRELRAQIVRCIAGTVVGDGFHQPVEQIRGRRSEERRGGEEGRSRWSAYHLKKKK